jgi:hypothetical protein
MSSQPDKISISGGIILLAENRHVFIEPLGEQGGEINYLLYDCAKQGGERVKVMIVNDEKKPTEYFLKSADGELAFQFEGKPITEPNSLLRDVLHIPDIPTVDDWIAGKISIPSNEQLWNLHKNYYRAFGDYEEAWHSTLLALGDFQTALIPLLNSVFNTTIDGDFGAGKTTILSAQSEASYHGIFADSVSPAFRARFVGRYNAPLFQDEIDKTQDDEGLGLALARTAYRRGAFYARWNPDKNEPDITSHFGPMTYTLHEIPDDNAFLSRSLAKITVSASGNFRLPVINNLRQTVSHKIASLLFFWRFGAIDKALHDGLSLRHEDIPLDEFMKSNFDPAAERENLFNLATEKLTEREKRFLRLTKGRVGELLYVALFVERVLGIDIIDDLISTVNAKIDEDWLPPDEVYVKFVELLADQQVGTPFELRAITLDLQNWCKETGRKAPQTNTISTWIRDLGFRIKNGTRQRRGGKIWLTITEGIKTRLENKEPAKEITSSDLEQSQLQQDNQDNQDNKQVLGGEVNDQLSHPPSGNGKDYPDYPDYPAKSSEPSQGTTDQEQVSVNKSSKSFKCGKCAFETSDRLEFLSHVEQHGDDNEVKET